MIRLITIIFLLSTLCRPQVIIDKGTRLATGTIIAPASLSLSPGWQFLQETFYNPGCSFPASTCTMNILPTTAGSMWVIQIVTANNVTINTANGWTQCPVSCHSFTSGFNQDIAYKIDGSAGTTSVSVTLSSNATGYFGMSFAEVLPPAGYVGTYDTSGHNEAGSCVTCTGVALSLSATDAIIQFQNEENNVCAGGWNCWSAPYITDIVNQGIYLNAISGIAPTLTQNTSGEINFSAIAFKSTAGSFTVPTPSPVFSIYSFTLGTTTYNQATGLTCNPTCSLTIPATQAGDLLFAQAGNENSGHISSVSGGGSWVVPTGANTCALTTNTQANSCAYVLSATAGTTTINFTMSGNSTYGINVYEIARTSGSFTLDSQNSVSVDSSTNNTFGPALTLSGTNDVIFQETTGDGFFNSAKYYAQPYCPTAAGFQVFYSNGAHGSSTGVLPNTVNGLAAQWIPQSTGSPVTLSAIGFK